MSHVCRRIELGRVGSITETMIKWEGSPIPVPYMYFRTSSIRVYADICAPDDLLNSFWNDIVSCAGVAAGVATLAAIVAGPEAALPAFRASFDACLSGKVGDRLGEIQIALSAQQEPNEDWHR